MTDMIERVARAICMAGDGAGYASDYADRHWRDHMDEAIAAINAMREPSEEMEEAGCDAWIEGIAGESMKTSYTAMIDAALGERK